MLREMHCAKLMRVFESASGSHGSTSSLWSYIIFLYHIRFWKHQQHAELDRLAKGSYMTLCNAYGSWCDWN